VYAVDISLPNMLFGKVLRSPIAYAESSESMSAELCQWTE